MRKVITRFPPSPTGRFHMGSARTALFNFLYARHHNGEFKFRFEDTDKERSKKEYEKDILESLRWLNLDFDGEIWRQSERIDVYKKYIKVLLDKGLAYEAEENKDKTGKVIRFKNPNKKIVFYDSLRGEISNDISDLGDFVIARSENEPLYHLAVVVDDYEMGITDIIRGEDGLSNTARQIALQEALDFDTPKYTHIPFILGDDKKKLSKRHGALSVLEYKNQGFLKEAVLNFLALLGWRFKQDDEKELWSLDELIDKFDLDGLQKAPAVFNKDKLLWLNKEYLKRKNDDEFFSALLDSIKDKEARNKIARVKKAILGDIKERVYLYSQINELIESGELNWLLDFKAPTNPEKLVWKKSSKQETARNLKELAEVLESAGDFGQDPRRVEEIVMPLAKSAGVGNLLWPTRYALTGQEKSASPFVVMAALGAEESLSRIRLAIALLES